MQSLRVGIETLLTSINKGTTDFKNQLLIDDAKEAETRKLEEHRNSFNHFSRDQKSLNEEQFRAFLISIGRLKKNAQEETVKSMMNGSGDGIDFNTILRRLNLGDKSGCSQLTDAFRILSNGKACRHRVIE